jgi:1-phosphofructokinase family hexose kinase
VILCVAASPSIDKLFEVERVEIGAIHRPDRFVQVAGGKGLNVARSARALGADVAATGILAGHAGRWIEEALGGEGVRANFAWADGETRASLSVADSTDRGLTEFYERGWAIGPDGWSRLERIVRDGLSEAKWMTISGNLPLGAPHDGYARLIEMAREAGVAAALDAREEALVLGMSARPRIVKVNEEEAGMLLGTTVETLEQAKAAAEEIRWRVDVDGGAAIVTRGAEGAVVATSEGAVLQARLYERGPYPVGSGDAFLGGLVTGLDRGLDWLESLALALGAAAANAEMPGAGRLDPGRAVELAKRAEVHPLEP